MRPRIVIVDDDPTFLRTARRVLEAQGFDVVGEASNGLDGVTATTRLGPDIVLVDVNLPDIDGFEVADRVADGEDAPPVVLTSIRSADDFGSLVETSRARAFLTKADLTGEALAAFLDPRPPSA